MTIDEEQTEAVDDTAGAPLVAEQAAAPQAAAAASQPAEPVEIIHPKERRRRARSAHAGGQPAPARTPQERDAERRDRRRRKALLRAGSRAKLRAKAAAAAAATPAPATPAVAPAAAPQTRNLKQRQGVVVSDKGDKTITVRIDVAHRHRRYGKVIRRSTALHAHDERNDAHAGDVVRVIECRPLSRTKHWRLVEILERAK